MSGQSAASHRPPVEVAGDVLPPTAQSPLMTGPVPVTPTLPTTKASDPAPSTSGEEGTSGAAVQSDHCYGLPYQDHNYGGPAVPAAPAVQPVSGRPPYPFKVRYPAGLRAMGGSAVRGNGGGSPSEEGDAREAFPVIGGLERYLNDETQEPDTSPAPAAARLRLPNHQPHVSYYQRYMSNPEQQHISSNATGYSQHLVQIGGRTYIRQMTGPNNGGLASSEQSGGSNVSVFRTRNDYMGVNNPPVLIPPYGGRGRGGPAKRLGRPRIARNVAPVAPPMPSVVPPNPVDPHSLTGGPAPLIAPSKGQRPAARARGPRRRSALTPASSSPIKSQGTGTPVDPDMIPEEDEKGVAGLLSAYDRRYAELLEKPCPGEASARTLPVTLHPHNHHSSLLTASAIVGSRQRVLSGQGQPGSARTRGKLSPFKGPTPPNFVPTPPQPPNLSPAGVGHKTPPAALPVPASPPKMEPGFEGLIVAQVVEELREERLEAARLAAKAAAAATAAAAAAVPVSPPRMTSPVKSPPLQINGAKGSLAQESRANPTERPGTDVSTETESELGAEAETSETETDSEGEWRGADYVTRCICGLQHNDEFMICCDQCDVWQHCRCLGIGRPPDTYLCERCNPRQLRISPDKARQFQLRKLERRAKDKQRKRAARTRRKPRAKAPKVPGPKPASFSETSVSEYSESVRGLLSSLPNTETSAELAARLAPNTTSVMFVAPQIQGLVATQTLPPQALITEYCGRVCLGPDLAGGGRDKWGRPLPFVLSYDLPACRVLVDARRKGSSARWVRRSCRPNCTVRHCIVEGELRLFLVASELVERGTELCLPWDLDWRSGRAPLSCACAQAPFLPSPEKGAQPPVCPIALHNQQLQSTTSKISAKQKCKRTVAKKRPNLVKKAPTKKKSFVAKKVAAAKAGKNRRLAIRMTGRGGASPAGPKVLRSKMAKMGSGNSSSARTTETEEAEERDDRELTLREDRSPGPARRRKRPSPTASLAPLSPPDLLACDKQPMSREERKMAQMIAHIDRMAEAERRKKEKGVSSVTPRVSPSKRPPPPRRTKWRKGPGKKRNPKRPPGRQLRSGTGSGKASEPSSDDEEEDEEEDGEDKSSDTEPEPVPVPAPSTTPSSPSLRHAPPRKRWISNQRNLESGTDSARPSPGEGPVTTTAKATPPSGGGTKKRWLRQAMSEDHSVSPLPTPTSRPPPKKRRMAEMTPPVNTEPLNREPLTAPAGLSRAEAAALLTQMGGQPEAAQVPSSPPQIPLDPAGKSPIHTEQTVHLPPPPHSSLSPFTPTLELEPKPELVKKRKKVSLDEYKKRKGVGGSAGEGSMESPAVSGPSTPALNSFIPQMDRLPDSARLSHLPDPQSIGKGTATLEDLKARIYGRKFLDKPGPTPPGLQEQPPPPPPPKPGGTGGMTSPPQSPPTAPTPSDAPRMSLNDRLRTEFGLEPEPDLASPEHLFLPSQQTQEGAERGLVNGRGGPSGGAGGEGEEDEEAEDGEIRDSPRPPRRRRPSPNPPLPRHRRPPKVPAHF